MQISPSIPSAIIHALPFVFLTRDRDVFLDQPPADLQVTKLFSKSDVEALQEEFLQVRDMGQGTMGEWLKGLPGRGSSLQHDALKWEKWESSGGIAKMCSLLYPGYESKPPLLLPRKPSVDGALAPPFDQGRHERSAERATELKEARKAEIERRALLLDPPLTADVLRHTPSFQAAIHIVARLDANAWERLKPRLLAQRAEAEALWNTERKERQEQQQLLTTLVAEKEARDRVDKDWEDVQGPLRAKIAGYADEAVQDNWGTGRKMTRDSCSRFAVDSLLYVRKRFYDEVAKDATAARAAGRMPPVDPPAGPFTQKLTLENMKWIFDTKIKPHTEPLRKELFYCNGCEGNFKPFGFEGVIQHYAAKHTSVLSLGSIVVHWRAEWPEHPPFSATARIATAPSHLHGHDMTGLAFNHGGPPLAASYNYPPPGTVSAPPPPGYPPPMGYGYAPPTYNDYNQQQPLLSIPYQQQPAAPPPFLPQPGYEQQPSYAAPPALYPSYQPPATPYGIPAAQSGQIHIPPQGVQYDYQQYGAYQATNSPYVPPQPSNYPDLYQAKVEDIARNSREVWRLLGDIRDLPGSVKVSVTMHHLVKRFQSRFYETPPLSMFIDGLSNNKEMRPVRNVNGLVCRACHLGLCNSASVEHDRKDFSLPQLANHFQSKHIEPTQGMQAASAPLNWVLDMVFVSDLAVSASLALPVSEPQRVLLSAALLATATPQPVPAAGQSYSQQQQPRHEQLPLKGQQTITANAQDGFQTNNGHTGRHDAAEPVGVGFLVDRRIPNQSPQSTTPGTLSEGDRSAQSEKARRPPQGLEPNRGQKANGKNKRAPRQGEGGSGDRPFGKRFKTGEAKRKREEVVDMRDRRATNQADAPPMHLSSTMPARPAARVAAQAREFTQMSAQTPQQPRRKHMRPLTDVEQEHNIMAALESYLDHRQAPPPQGQQEAANPPSHSNQGDSGTLGGFQPSPATYARYGDGEDSARSSLPSTRVRSPAGRQVDTASYSRPMAAERREDVYGGTQRPQAGFVEPLRRRAEADRFGLPARGHNTSQPEADYRPHDHDGRLQSRPPVETYEIVHVIDEQGEYYIRRPVRREPDPRYIYEERRVRHEGGPYPAFEPVYAPVPRASLVREGGRSGVAPEARPGDRRADSTYFEEYDPRFPAA